jgi:hypothetical protein
MAATTIGRESELAAIANLIDPGAAELGSCSSTARGSARRRSRARPWTPAGHADAASWHALRPSRRHSWRSPRSATSLTMPSTRSPRSFRRLSGAPLRSACSARSPRGRRRQKRSRSASSGHCARRGRVHFTSSDPLAALPADYIFTALDGGAHTFTMPWFTSGFHTVTVTDTVNPAITGTSISVFANP